MPKKDDLIDSDSGSEKKNDSGSEGSDAEEEEYVVEEIRDKRMKAGKVRIWNYSFCLHDVLYFKM